MAVITRKRGLFTLVELLIVIAVIAILASLFLPALRKARESAKGSMCQSNIRQLGICFNNYTSDYDGYLPSNERTLYVEFANGDVWAANGCWYQAQIGPYLQLNKNDKSIGYCPSSFFLSMKIRPCITAHCHMVLIIDSDMQNSHKFQSRQKESC
jgi:prepilin-type N-terminal cleavage/methylation domain-containing protein